MALDDMVPQTGAPMSDVIEAVLQETDRQGFTKERTESGWSLRLDGHAILHLQYEGSKGRGLVLQFRWMRGWADPELLRAFRERIDPLLSTFEPDFPSIALDRLWDPSRFAEFSEAIGWFVNQLPGRVRAVRQRP